jgi:ketosteroid isomerase-like protein
VAVERAEARRVRRRVVRLQGCLEDLGRRQQRFLKLRAGLGRRDAATLEQAARGAGVPRGAARRFERRALRALGDAARAGSCGPGGRVAGPAGAPSRFLVLNDYAATVLTAVAGPAPVTLLAMTAGAGRGDQHEPRQDVRGVKAAAPRDGDAAPGGGGRRTAGAPPAATAEPTTDSLPGAAVPALVAALAGLLALLLVRRRVAATTATVAPARPTTAAPPVPARRLAVTDAEALVRSALMALNEGDVDAAAAVMHPDVTWPGDPGRPPLEGRNEFREYWTNVLVDGQVEFAAIAFHVEDGWLEAVIHEAMRNRFGSGGYAEYHGHRRFRFRDGLIVEMAHGGSGGRPPRQARPDVSD